MHIRQLTRFAAISLGIWGALLGSALWLGGPSQPNVMAGFNNPFKQLDYRQLPPVQTFAGADGTALAYRLYPPPQPARGSVTLVHGSSASSHSMHPLAMALQAAGYQVWALDMRGHGASGKRGHIDYIGQLEDDLATFARTVQPAQPATLLGF